MYEQKREPKIVMGLRKRAAQESGGQAPHHMHEEKLAGGQERLDDGGGRAGRRRDPRRLVVHGRTARARSVPMPGTWNWPRHARRVVDLHGPETRADRAQRRGQRPRCCARSPGSWSRWRARVTAQRPAAVPATAPDRLLDGELSVAENVARLAPGATNNRIREGLARFLFRGARADQQAATLSGGERPAGAALAALMLADPAPQLPGCWTSRRTTWTSRACGVGSPALLESYEGALVVASHDLPRFLESIATARWLLMEEGELREITPEAVGYPA
ncbi:hypothetical protein LV779_27915 [Streptomyces thinghirensis]|nr:hypothetical protein [Streptomyces thinghirensis]